ncbi:hypothetical protein D8B26_003015 [Coccidioides posadasii str. Silveira]|uniref:Uncharacterized protein n=2 Tax=Coccidioides posadasii TaxID=199306 RepID=E9CXH1_COCPS|nr:hypothetical protein CPC735_007670 [Coccidioides posadasii C735 delta SOWgp]EER26594.1 hypothetical protein CPC735_007670 [Coccidioides posadasii C735 delta SOWgp]EFW20648.1 conserved hypothetical protein [Coccidioides posadasii str. Silveira]QVM08323.1 hypothetical protein D8B26_003015 [Coccidioides posadasii str. Silveira]|eukprot:XP_003068739.1 hypothetical protein CPC735_007670 [Coccidioides posadasii C735 delta SOWgp]
MIPETGSFRRSHRTKGKVIPEFKAEGRCSAVRKWDPEAEMVYLGARCDPAKLDPYWRAASREAGSERCFIKYSWEKLLYGVGSPIGIFARHRDAFNFEQKIPRTSPRGYQARLAGKEDRKYHIQGIRNESSIMSVPLRHLMAMVDPSAAPLLQSLNEQDLGTMGSFLLTGEYPPVLIECRGGQHPLSTEPPPPGAVTHFLEGLHTQEDYERELIRCEHVYQLAHVLKLPGLKMLVVRKLQFGFPYLDERLVIEVADSIFSSMSWHWKEPYGARYTTEEASDGRYEREREPMRAFLVEYFARKLASVSITESDLFQVLLRKHPALRIGAYLRAAEVGLDQWASSENQVEEEEWNVEASEESDLQSEVPPGALSSRRSPLSSTSV